MTCNFRERLAAAATYPDECFAAFLLANDIAGSKLGREQRDRAIAGSLACGAAVAEQLSPRALPGGRGEAPGEIARRLGVAIAEADLAGPVGLLSRYEPDKKTIFLNRGVLSRIEQAAVRYGLAGLWGGPFAAAEIAVAHELFHHVECGDKSLFTRCHKITLWRIGPFRYQSAVPALSEIAAMACAKALCRLPFNPLLLEAVLLETAGEGQGMAWLDKLDCCR